MNRQGAAFARFHLNFRDRVAAMPGVESVGIIENIPLNEGPANGRFRSEEMISSGSDGTLLNFTFADGNYFGTMGIDVLRGRVFDDADHISNHDNVVLSRSAAELLWPGGDPIGRRIEGLQSGSLQTVVGVVEDVMQYSYRDTAQPLMYFPLRGADPASWVLSSPAYVVKTPRAGSIGPEIRTLVRELAPYDVELHSGQIDPAMGAAKLALGAIGEGGR